MWRHFLGYSYWSLALKVILRLHCWHSHRASVLLRKLTHRFLQKTSFQSHCSRKMQLLLVSFYLTCVLSIFSWTQLVSKFYHLRHSASFQCNMYIGTSHRIDSWLTYQVSVKYFSYLQEHSSQNLYAQTGCSLQNVYLIFVTSLYLLSQLGLQILQSSFSGLLCELEIIQLTNFQADLVQHLQEKLHSLLTRLQHLQSRIFQF